MVGGCQRKPVRKEIEGAAETRAVKEDEGSGLLMLFRILDKLGNMGWGKGFPRVPIASCVLAALFCL